MLPCAPSMGRRLKKNQTTNNLSLTLILVCAYNFDSLFRDITLHPSFLTLHFNPYFSKEEKFLRVKQSFVQKNNIFWLVFASNYESKTPHPASLSVDISSINLRE